MMTRMTGRLSLLLRAACLVALSALPARAGAPLFIQGSEVNLRDKPATSAKVVGKAAIGTECQHVKNAPKQWVRIRCGEVEGFTQKSLVGAEKPRVDALLAQAQATTLGAKVRLDAAMRAATLDLENAQAQKLLARLFFDVNFEQLRKDQRKGGLQETSWVMRRVLEEQPTVKREPPEEALRRELEKIEYDWHQLQVRGIEFVSAMSRGGQLVVYTGYFRSMKGRFKLEITDDEEEFLVVIESRSSSAVPEALERALRQDARPFTPDERRYSELHQESPDMPVLSREALRLYRSLPMRWHELMTGKDGRLSLWVGCGIKGADLRLDVHRRASIWWRWFQLGQGEHNEEVDRVAGITKTANTYVLQLRSRQGFKRTLTLTWPTDHPEVSRWDLELRLDGPRFYAIEKSRRIRLDVSGCPDYPDN